MIARRHGARAIGGLLLLALSTGAAGAAGAAEISSEPTPARSETWQGRLGVRETLIRDRGFDPFATTDALPQLSLAVSRVMIRRGATALALGLGLDTGTSEAQARSARAHLGVTRASVPIELRVAPLPRAYAFARVAPGLMIVAASMTDDSSPAKMTGDFNALSVDGSAGVAVCLTPDRSVVGVWIQADAGYGYTPSHDLVLRPSLAGADQSKAGDLTLAPLAARGAFGRIGVAITY